MRFPLNFSSQKYFKMIRKMKAKDERDLIFLFDEKNKIKVLTGS